MCVDSEDIEKCDKNFDDFDVGKEMIKSAEECDQLEAYKRCVERIVSKSKCNPKLKNIAIQYLESRIKLTIDCKTGIRFAERTQTERVLIKPQMQSQVDGICSENGICF